MNMIDIVIPNKNETALIEMAEKLNIKALIFAYKNKADFYIAPKQGKIQITNALLCETKQIRNAHDKQILTICQASREAIEQGAQIIYGFENDPRKDRTHYKTSGLNHILAQLATEKGATIAFSAAAILQTNGPKRAVLFGRIMQNITFCTKYKTPMKIASFATQPSQLRSPNDLASLFIELGMHPEQAKKALEFTK